MSVIEQTPNGYHIKLSDNTQTFITNGEFEKALTALKLLNTESIGLSDTQKWVEAFIYVAEYVVIKQKGGDKKW